MRGRNGIKKQQVFAVVSRLCLGAVIAWSPLAPAQAITGQSVPAPELAPYAVMVLKRSGVSSGFCSASVIAPDVVLTAAHCVASPADTRIHFHGDHDEPVLANVAAIIKHPLYRADAVRSRHVSIDLALIRLEAPLPARFKPIGLAKSYEIKLGEPFRLAGFGVMQEQIASSSGHLRVSRVTARAPLSSILLWTEDPAGHGTGACTGDSGGPILAEDKPLLIAVTDWAEGSGQQKCGALTQGALIAPQRQWIDRVLAGWGH